MPLQFITSVTSVAYERNYGLLLFTHPLGEQDILQIINRHGIKGAIYARTYHSNKKNVIDNPQSKQKKNVANIIQNTKIYPNPQK